MGWLLSFLGFGLGVLLLLLVDWVSAADKDGGWLSLARAVASAVAAAASGGLGMSAAASGVFGVGGCCGVFVLVGGVFMVFLPCFYTCMRIWQVVLWWVVFLEVHPACRCRR